MTAPPVSPAVIEARGEPVERGSWVSGSVNTSGPGGKAGLMFPISGPSGRGMLSLEATKSAGIWTFDLRELEVGDYGRRIDLLEPAERPETEF